MNQSNVVEAKEEQIAFSFDMETPVATTSEELFEPVQDVVEEVVQGDPPERVVFELTEDVNEIEVNEPTAVDPVNEHNEEGIKRYRLDMSEETETIAEMKEEVVFETKTIEPIYCHRSLMRPLAADRLYNFGSIHSLRVPH